MTETNDKSLELLKEAIPTVSRLAVIYDPATPSHAPGLKAIEEVGPTVGMSILPAPVRAEDKILFRPWRVCGAWRQLPA
jgi:hypothetical protein